MRKPTQSFLKKLAHLDWFTNVGKPMSDEHVHQVFSWNEALVACDAKDSKTAALESANVLSAKLHADFREQYQRWNSINRELKKHTKPLVKEKTEAAVRIHRLPEAFLIAVHWDILLACIELEYEDLVSPLYFKDRAAWYLSGHWPCGWEGDFPRGRLIVF